jgi:hypothetical protein
VTKLFSLTPSDLVKLAQGSTNDSYGPGPGEYYLAYRKLIDEILGDERTDPNSIKKGLTPHLDQRWHIPGAFPEMTIQKTKEVIISLLDAYVLALATGRLKQGKKGGKAAVYYLDWTRIGRPDAERFLVSPKDEMDIFQAFITDHPAVQTTLECADDWLDRLLLEDGLTSGTTIQESAIYKGLLDPPVMLKAALCDHLLKSREIFLTKETKDLSIVERLYVKIKEMIEQAMRLSKPDEIIDSTISTIGELKNQLKQYPDFTKMPNEVKERLLNNIEDTLKRLTKTWRSSL